MADTLEILAKVVEGLKPPIARAASRCGPRTGTSS
jgi:hypothetical protein